MKRNGFTLIEVMVALFVIALGVGALLSTLVSSAGNTMYLRDKSFAQWIAYNRIADVRLAGARPSPDITRDTLQYAGGNWRWEQEISEAGIGDLLRIDVRVARLGDIVEGERAPTGGDSNAGGDDLPSLGTAIGFIGQSLARPSGSAPEWSPRVPQGLPGGGGNPLGGAGGGGRDESPGP